MEIDSKGFYMNLTKQKAQDCGLIILKNDVEIGVFYDIEASEYREEERLRKLTFRFKYIEAKNGLHIKVENLTEPILEDICRRIADRQDFYSMWHVYKEIIPLSRKRFLICYPVKYNITR